MSMFKRSCSGNTKKIRWLETSEVDEINFFRPVHEVEYGNGDAYKSKHEFGNERKMIKKLIWRFFECLNGYSKD